MDLFEEHRELKSVLGDFLVEFSTVEFYLTFYCQAIQYPTNRNIGFVQCASLDLSRKRSIVKDHIKNNLPDLLDEWNKLNTEIGNLNNERRHLVHGVGLTGLTSTQFTTQLPKSGQIISKEYNKENILELVSKLKHLLTGENGLAGHFYEKFMVKAYDWYNDNEAVKPKVTFSVNGKVLTKYKG